MFQQVSLLTYLYCFCILYGFTVVQMVIVPEMIGSLVGVYNGKNFNTVEIKPEMIGSYLGEYSCTYKFVRHGRPGIGATNSSRFVPLK